MEVKLDGSIVTEYPSIHVKDSDLMRPRKPYMIRHPEIDNKFTVGFVERGVLYLISNIYEIRDLIKVNADYNLFEIIDDMVFCSRAKAIALSDLIELYYWKKSIRA